jgi:hypothetical protein
MRSACNRAESESRCTWDETGRGELGMKNSPSVHHATTRGACATYRAEGEASAAGAAVQHRCCGAGVGESGGTDSWQPECRTGALEWMPMASTSMGQQTWNSTAVASTSAATLKPNCRQDRMRGTTGHDNPKATAGWGSLSRPANPIYYSSISIQGGRPCSAE